jgi:hypothetical protein
LPPLPVIVTWYVPEGPRHESPTIVEKSRLTVSLLSEHARPDGEIERERFTVPVKFPKRVIVIVDKPGLVEKLAIFDGFGYIEKFAGTGIATIDPVAPESTS